MSALPNWFAYLVLFSWPLVCVVLFQVLRLELAAILSLLAGYLLLPSGTSVDLPLLPAIDRNSVPAVTTFLLCWIKAGPTRAPGHSALVWLLAAAFTLSPLATSFFNSYELVDGAVSLPGFYPVDGLKMGIGHLIALAPFFIGARLLRTAADARLLIACLGGASLIYSLPMLFEVRMSPQLHQWVYGYFPHSFAQQIRGGGFRPVVFLDHGLHVALFTTMGLTAVLVAKRGRRRVVGLPAGPAAAYLAAVLLLCKTLGTAVYAALIAPVVLFCRPRTWVRVACVVMLLVCAYPLLRSSNLIPVGRIIELAKHVSEDRSSSFATRVANEDLLLAKALQKPILGWGTWGRNRLYDPVTGRDLSVTDGGWIIRLGMYGLLGYLAFFALLTLPILRLNRTLAKIGPADAIAPAGLALILAINVLDMVPNSFLTPLTFLIAGTLAGMRQLELVGDERSPPVRRFGRRRSPLQPAGAPAADKPLAHIR